MVYEPSLRSLEREKTYEISRAYALELSFDVDAVVVCQLLPIGEGRVNLGNENFVCYSPAVKTFADFLQDKF